jgi:putative ATP-binding cassette transporter
MLDEDERWDRRLNDNEKQCLVVARVLLQKPQWVVLNRALGAIDPVLRHRLASVLAKDLPDVGILYIGRIAGEEGFFGRVLKLVEDAGGPCFKPSASPEVIPYASKAEVHA